MTNTSVRQVEPLPDWLKLPTKVQHQFFEHAEQEAQRTKELLLDQKQKLDKIREMLRFENAEQNDSWKEWRIAVVDGSDSPVLSERVGGRYGTFAAGYHIYKGLDLLEEDYFSGVYVDDQIGSNEASQKVLQLVTTELERRAAVECLDNKNVDLILIDGPFFGFRPRCRIIADKDIHYSNYRKGRDLVNMLVALSQKLLDSGKVCGIVKRVQTAAIDGWTIYKTGNQKLVTRRNDKDLLASFMKTGETFSYSEQFGSYDAYQYLSRMAWSFGRFYTSDTGRSVQSIYDACKGDVQRNIKFDLGPKFDSERILQTARVYLRASYPSQPIALESKPETDLLPVLAYCLATCNKATGLPIALDLIDHDVGIPRGFTQEFIEEVEATLARDSDLDKFELETRFSSLNPQKQE